MSTFMTLPAVPPLFLFASLLVIKMFAVGFTTALWRSKAKIVVNPEDVGVNPGSHVETQDAPNVMRAKRAHLNDLENIPGFLVLATLFTLAGASKNAGWAYFGLYCGARMLHTLFYLAQAQPWRTIAFVIGQITMVGVAVQLIMKAFM